MKNVPSIKTHFISPEEHVAFFKTVQAKASQYDGLVF